MRKQLVGFDRGNLPDELRARLDACPDCRSFFERTETIRQLLALKNYERPRADVEARCVENVRRRLNALVEESASSAWDWREIWLGPVPAFRFGVAALFAAFIGLHMLSSTPRPLSQWTPQPVSRTVSERPADAPDTRTPMGTRLLYQDTLVTTASNGQPVQIQQPPSSHFRLINLEP